MRDEAITVKGEHGMPSAQSMEKVRRFYAPFNSALAKLLGDVGFLWK